MATIPVLDADAVEVAVQLPLAPGRAAAASSKPVVISTEDLAALGSLTETAPASDTASSGLNGRLQRIAQNLTSLIAMFTLGAGTAAAALRTTLASDDPALVAITKTVITSTASYTRPANTTLYTVGDAFSDSTTTPAVLTFSNVASVNGKGGIIYSMEVLSSNNPGTPLQGYLHLFDAAPTPVNDNAAFTVSDAQMLTKIVSLPFTLRTIGANSHASISQPGSAFTTSGATSIYGLVEVANGYTPASGEVLTFRLQIVPVG